MIESKVTETYRTQDLYTCFHFRTHQTPEIQIIWVTVSEEWKETQCQLVLIELYITKYFTVMIKVTYKLPNISHCFSQILPHPLNSCKIKNAC